MLAKDPAGGRVRVDYPGDLPALGGHFPEFPIVPGVFLVEAAERSARAVVARPLGPWTAIQSARFRSPVLPGDSVTIDVTSEAPGPLGSLARCRLFSNEREVAVVRLAFSGQKSLGWGVETDEQHGSGDPGALDRLRSLDICQVLPHRFPMLLVDRVIRIDPGRTIQACKAVTVAEQCYADAPTTAGYPWALVVESWCQAAGMLALGEPEPRVQTGDLMLFGGIAGIELGAPVLPGTVMVHQAKVVRDLGETVVLTGRTLVEGQPVMTVDRITIALRPAIELAADAQRAPGSHHHHAGFALAAPAPLLDLQEG